MAPFRYDRAWNNAAKPRDATNQEGKKKKMAWGGANIAKADSNGEADSPAIDPNQPTIVCDKIIH